MLRLDGRFVLCHDVLGRPGGADYRRVEQRRRAHGRCCGDLAAEPVRQQHRGQEGAGRHGYRERFRQQHLQHQHRPGLTLAVRRACVPRALVGGAEADRGAPNSEEQPGLQYGAPDCLHPLLHHHHPDHEAQAQPPHRRCLPHQLRFVPGLRNLRGLLPPVPAGLLAGVYDRHLPLRHFPPRREATPPAVTGSPSTP